ncbi:pyridoxamine 5'-phosphate oxidase family protein [Desulfoluna spongiiphila]|uniref:pyridoxamine 5'-phosphate oxidase family protein n=1 Tax=Desulfoluna spongiiphila TaxID=419481 RepID=UPI0012562251|nr:pyridoxamine 5'-phosphate oxidase family protein [Desulfoluna spongiiphila]VVS94167.1 pyridoxamine 5'-phosphate oxidase-related [Desulfoluna spongiiphila]
MFREMKRGKKRLSDEGTQAILEAGDYGILSTVGEDGTPYGIPLNYVFHDGRIIFHCAPSGYKLDNIAHCSRVSFCVVAQADIVPEKFTTRFQSVVAFGTARILEGDEKKEGLLALVRRLCPDHIPAGETYINNAWDKTTVVAVDIAHLSGKAAPGPGGRE